MSAMLKSFPRELVTPRGQSIVQKASEFPRAAGMLELSQRLGLDLGDAFARDGELLADLFQRVIGVHADTETHAQYALLARRERGQHARRRLAKIRLNGSVDRQNRVLVFDEIAQMAVFLVADRRLEADRLFGNLENLAHLLERHREALR